MSSPTKEPAEPPSEHEPTTRAVNWQDFREHLATAAKDGSRRWIYAKKPSGRWTDRRTWISWILIGVMFAGPFIKIGGNPLLMMNIIDRKFSILGKIFWPEDTIIFAVAMLTFFAGIMIFTTAFGRLWCGWTCPQTVMMEMVFRKLEYLIEGDANDQRALDAAPWDARKVFKKGLKHAIFFGLSFLIGNTLLSYIIGSDQLWQIITDDPRKHVAGLVFMMLFTLIFYAIFARFREQACTFICPYGRFQSALLDENTMIVAYDHKRGETRAPWKRDQPIELRQASGQGDCVNCHQCVAVCPTGIDIRNGVQMECVNCTACIDACDTIMDKIGRPRGLIRYASLNGIESGSPLKITARMKLYAGVLAGLVLLFLFLVFTRSEVETLFLRARGSLFQQTAAGNISNLYTVKVVNKSNRDLPIEFRVDNLDCKLSIMGAKVFMAPKAKLVETSVLVEIEPSKLTGNTTALEIGVYSNGRKLESLKTAFVGPRH
jgi:cytochrome c oxidase accessory protein FixG